MISLRRDLLCIHIKVFVSLAKLLKEREHLSHDKAQHGGEVGGLIWLQSSNKVFISRRGRGETPK